MRIIKLLYEIEKEDFVKAGQASSEVKKVLKQLGVSSEITRRVSIATYEAEMNIVIHSFGGKIEVEIDINKIIITARDRGPGIENIDLAMQEGYTTASEKVRELGFGAGMGLPNIKRCADEFYINSIIDEYTELKITTYL
ncbi:anti-sigma regulatory factor [Serpentinicella sp. ANB-PHB4]|uniref:ATP-binding protein n=1 Tax=Serpentinicella sp. ANB-PHB4 TaxID=3074076 RepID=UPI00285CFF9B|nr:anti-sigma regulatory factor [Serpentinicella sp. ANB-PHB4]MDR5657873.1 anti-sigma regulatory factor [Serpentinicella sp. ANB-PHB4]